MRKRKEIKKVAIIGLGLMGGSLALALKKQRKGVRVFGISRSVSKVRSAKQKKIIDDGVTSVKALLNKTNIDLFVIATPVRLIKRKIKEIDDNAVNPVIVTDLGSTKHEIVTWAESQAFSHVSFVGSHPMAGSHATGLDSARVDLYTDSLCFVTKTRRTNVKSMESILTFWRWLNVKTHIVSPAEHDGIVAEISHLPHVVANTLVNTVSRSNMRGLQFAGPGFLDSTRIAQSDAQLWVDIFLSNKKNVLREIKKFQKALNTFSTKLSNDDSRSVLQFLINAEHIRTRIESKQ